MSGVRLGRGRDACTGLGKFAPLKRATWGNGSARCKSAQKVHLSRVPQCALPGHRHQPRTGRQLQTADCAPPAHLLPQYCTLLGKTRHRHRPRTGRRLQTVRPGASAAPVLHSAWQNPAPASPPHRSPTADCATPDSAAPAPPVRTACPPHPVLPEHSPRRPTCKQRTPHPPNGRRGVNTQRGVSARRLTRQLRKSPRPQRRHLRCRLLARPLRERQRPQEQQR